MSTCGLSWWRAGRDGRQRGVSSRLLAWRSKRVDHAKDERAEQDEEGGLDGGV